MMVDIVHREKFPGLSIKLLQVLGPSMNDARTISENQQCKCVNGQNFVPAIQLDPENHLHSAKVFTTELLPHSASVENNGRT